jgi:hypothetical protein
VDIPQPEGYEEWALGQQWLDGRDSTSPDAYSSFTDPTLPDAVSTKEMSPFDPRSDNEFLDWAEGVVWGSEYPGAPVPSNPSLGISPQPARPLSMNGASVPWPSHQSWTGS